MPEDKFRERSIHHGRLRPGVIEFLERCHEQKVPVYVASCGIRTYIDCVLESQLPAHLYKGLHGIHCNDVVFGPQGVTQYCPPDGDPSSPYPLDKGALSLRLKKQHAPSRVYGIGNGSSDRSFWPHVDRLAATEGLARWCTDKNIPFRPFENFFELLDIEVFR